VRIDFPQISHFGDARRIDPAEKKRRNGIRNRKWQQANRPRLAELARIYRAKKSAAGIPYNNRQPKTSRRRRGSAA
jgi:hypothetical protein